MRRIENLARVAITGGPGAGKTTVLSRLRELGHPVVPESAREIISNRRADGLSARPPPLEFAQAIFKCDVERYRSVEGSTGTVFFDRSIVDSLGMLVEANGLPPADTRNILDRYPYHATAFILPPWREIYCTDSERDQTYEDSVRVCESLRNWYATCGYTLREVPEGTPDERCEFIMNSLRGASTAV
jgi:predicted ATPase